MGSGYGTLFGVQDDWWVTKGANPWSNVHVVESGGNLQARIDAAAAAYAASGELQVVYAASGTQYGTVTPGVVIMPIESLTLQPKRRVWDKLWFEPPSSAGTFLDPRPGGRVVLRVDDSSADLFTTNLHTYGAPLYNYILQYGIPLTVGLSYGDVGASTKLTAEQVRQLYNAGCDICAHAYSTQGTRNWHSAAGQPTNHAEYIKNLWQQKQEIEALVASGAPSGGRIGIVTRGFVPSGSWVAPLNPIIGGTFGDFAEMITRIFEWSHHNGLEDGIGREAYSLEQSQGRQHFLNTVQMASGTYANFLDTIMRTGQCGIALFHTVPADEWFYLMLNTIRTRRDAGTLIPMTASGAIDGKLIPGGTGFPEGWGIPWGDMDDWGLGALGNGVQPTHQNWQIDLTGVGSTADIVAGQALRLTRDADAGDVSRFEVRFNVPTVGHQYELSFTKTRVSGASEVHYRIYSAPGYSPLALEVTVANEAGPTVHRAIFSTPDWSTGVFLRVWIAAAAGSVNFKGFRCVRI